MTETSRRTCLRTICCCFPQSSRRCAGSQQSLSHHQKTSRNCPRYPNPRSTRQSCALTQTGLFQTCPCDNRACKNCEMKPVELLQPLADYRDESLKWYAWEYVWLLKKGEKKRIMSCVEKTTTVANRPGKLRLNKIQ